MAHQQSDHDIVGESQSHLHQHASIANTLDEQGLQNILPQQDINPSSSQQSAYNDSPHLSFNQRVDDRHSQQQNYIQARSTAAAIASAQYGYRLSVYLTQMASNQPPISQDSVLQDRNQEQTDDTVDINEAHQNIADNPADSVSAMAQQPSQAPEPSSRRRYTPEEEQTIATMMQAGATAREIGQRLDRSASSILLKWGRMRGRFGDPHAAEKRRRDGRGDRL